MSGREQILNRLRSLRQPQAEQVRRHLAFSAVESRDARELARVCGEALKTSGGSWEWVDSPAAARMALVVRMQAWGIDHALTWPEDTLPVPGVHEIASAFGITLKVPLIPLEGPARLEALSALRRIPLGITGADAAFASTGTIVICSQSARSHFLTMWVERHLVLVPAAAIHPSPEAWLAAWRAAGRINQLRQSREVVFISGPSRSADIELETIYGVFGPRHLHVMFIGDE